MDCEQELRCYREAKGMAAFIENELAMLKEMRDDKNFNDEEIESRSFGTTEHAAFKGTANVSRVERCAMEQATGSGGDEIAAELKSLERKLTKLNYSIRRVEAMLCALTQRELLVVQKFYIEGYPWSDVVAFYKQEMPSPREADALKATRNAAMAKMKQIYSRCKISA